VIVTLTLLQNNYQLTDNHLQSFHLYVNLINHFGIEGKSKAKNLRRKKQFCGTNHKTWGKSRKFGRDFFAYTLQINCPTHDL
jgi:hypothetical protein